MTRPAGFLVAAAVGALAGAGLLLWLHPSPGPQAPIVQVDTLWMEAQRPHLAKPSLGQKLTTARVRGQVAIAAAPSAPAWLTITGYCAPVIGKPESGKADLNGLRNSVISDSTVPPALLPDFGGRRAGPRLELYSTLNSARRWSWTGTVRGRATWQSSGDSVLVRGDRLWVRVVRGAPRCGAYGAAGGAIGALVGQDLRQAAVTGLVAALACAF